MTNNSYIHPTAIINPKAIIGKDVHVGPYCCIDADVTLDDQVHLVSHVCISGHTKIGARTKIFPFASIGHAPQDLKYHGEPSSVIIGMDNTIREYVTIQPGTQQDLMKTVVGDNCLLMVGSHVAHDCILGNHVILANNATLGGHVKIGDYVILGGLSAVQQFVRIGDHAMIGGMSGIEKDVLPYAMVIGERAFVNGINIIGLRRRGFDNSTIQKIQKVYDEIFADSNIPFLERVQNVEKNTSLDPAVESLFNFIAENTKRSYCQPKNSR